MKHFFKPALLLFLSQITWNLYAQDVVWRDTFTQYVTPSASQVTRWTDFCASLTSSKQYYRMKITGTYDQTGKICKDYKAANDFAAALYGGSAYASGVIDGNNWTVCNRFSGEVWLNPPSLCNGSNCPSPGYILRPALGNSNWGGVNTATCGGLTQWQEFRFSVVPALSKDVGTLSISSPDACTPTQDIQARFRNFGTSGLDSFEYKVSVNGTIYGPYWIKTALSKGAEATITVLSNFTFTPSTNYSIYVISDKPDNFQDSFRTLDTAFTTFFFNGSKGTPNAFDTAVCGSQSVKLRATPNAAGDSIAWYSDRTMNNLVGYGNSYTTKLLPSGAKYKFYVSSYNGYKSSKVDMDYSYVYYWPGNMFDVKALVNDLFVDSIGLNVYAIVNPVGSNVDVEVYIREGSYTDAGATTTPSMWTQVHNGKVTSRGSQAKSAFPFKYTFKKGKSYGVYVRLPGDGILFDQQSRTVTNGEIEIKTGTANYGLFGNALNNYDFDGEIFYHYLMCKSAPDSAIADIKPTPYGARLQPGTPFQAAPKNSGTGTKNVPHVVALGDTLGFDLKSPTNFSDQLHNSTWKVASVTMQSKGGRSLSTFSWVDPDATNNIPGKLLYWPGYTEIDSVVMIKIRLQELGGSACDTFLTHYIYVAPRPKADFTRASKICDGDPVAFTNTSTLQSGFLEYKWYFGTGDSSEAADPIYEYPAYGTYYCSLRAMSSNYGYVHIKIDTVTITQIPNVSFSIANACETKTHLFTNKTTASGGALSYVWDFGDMSSPSFLKDPAHTYANIGQYKVTLTASAGGCQASLSKFAYLFPKPKANFTYPTNGIIYCTNSPVTFTSTSTIASGNLGLSWLFDAVNVATVPKPIHTFDLPGTYNVKLHAISEFGCRDSITKTLTIREAPEVSFTNGQVCDQTPTVFVNTTGAISGTVANYKWSFGDGQGSTAASPTHQYSILGPKTVKLVMNLSNGCSDSATANIVVGTQAIVDFNVANTCSGKEVQFENNTVFKQGTVKYKWLFGGIDSTELTDPKYTFDVVGSTTFNITLTATVDGGCVSTLTKPMTVFELPDCGFTITDDWTQAADGYRTIKVQADNITYPFYRYKFSDGGSLTTPSGVYQFPYEGDFTVTLVTRNTVDCECSSTQLKEIRNSTGTSNVKGQNLSIYPNPSTGIVNVEASTGIERIDVYNILGDKLTLSANINGNKGVLEFGDASNGIYLVKVTTSAGSTTRRVTINR